jgi:uncharacterized membrane protein
MANTKTKVEMEHRLERLVFFSDAVFAIAITLLVIEIHVPDLPSRDPRVALEALDHLVPSFFGFALSFLVIGRFWIGHHSALSRATCFTARMMWPNLLLLMSISFMPFATAFMAANIGQLVPTAFYNLVLLVTALLSWRMVSIAIDHWPADEANDERKAMRNRGLGVAMGAATALAFTLVSPIFSQMALISIPLWQRLLTRFSR